MNLYRRVIGYYRPYLGTICFSLILQVIGSNLNLLKFMPIQWIIDHVLTRQAGEPVQWQSFTFSPGAAALYAALAMVALYLLAGLTGFWSNYVSIEVGLKALLQVRTQLYSYLQYLPLHFHDRRRSGDSTFRVAYDSQAIQTFFNRGFDTIVGSSIALLITFVYMLKMDPELAFISLLILPPLWLTIYFFSARVRRQTTTLQQEESDVLARASEGLTSIRIVHAFGQEEYEVREFEREARQSYTANLNLTITSAISSLAVSVVMALGLSLVLYVATLHILDHRLSIGQLTLFLAYVGLLYQPLERLSYTAWAMEGAVAGMQRVFEILDAEDSVPEMPGAKPMPRARGEIAFENVGFAYEPDHPILRGISLEIKPGQTVALVGGTGAGKTTLLSLVPRFYDPGSGRVRVDGFDVRDATKKSLRANISVVLQDTLLLSGTVLENIAYGRPEASRPEIRAAAEAAQADAFIQKLPRGYDTEVGERGVRLSGGQKQRIGLARAFLKNAPILLLDEPTSALDLETEAEIMETLQALMRRFTTLIVTHRLSTIHHVDCIHVLDNGSVVESGTGPELLARAGVYARLWNAAGQERRKTAAPEPLL
ncbi:MAG: ABC transporter ATP-binding protein/permease [Methylacidiphilales bacterium]|nr:ABC transporter ATP-binding protein/permease [Candidatus Methylacidiphilales bacterium]